MKKDGERAVKLTVEKIRRSDSEAEEIIKDEIKKQGIVEASELSRERREKLIESLKSKGLCCRQIMAVTGLSRRMVEGV